ncbi:caspase family protein [Roseibium sp.]|uniref:caspase family protein n=1 Tax=Roseibium sp. TaxID=1936156 RepID=UPI003B51ABA0
MLLTDPLTRPLRWLLLAGLMLIMAVQPVKASDDDDDEDDDRLALVIGNGAYQNITALDNPVNDAVLMAKHLTEVGFEVTLVTDATQVELGRAISAFGRKLRDEGDDTTGLFFYAGHGVQSFGSNYLLPIDVEVLDAADLSLVGVPADAVLRQMYSARNRTNIFILDACRNNPFAEIPDLNDNGLAEMKAPRGTFLAYSTAPGEIAVDGTGSNSPFSEALASRLSEPGVPIEALFKEVRRTVLQQTNGLQIPWDTSSLTVDFQFSPAVAPTPEELQLRQLWDSVKLSQDPIQVLLFLRANPDTIFNDEARALLAKLLPQSLNQETAAAPAEAPAAPKPEPVDPEVAERDMIEEARKTGTAEAYKAYLEAYPTGAFAELARLELTTIETNAQSRDPIAEPVAPAIEPAPKPAQAPPAEKASTEVAFNAPLGIGGPEIATRSIAELITGSPMFPPVEGLPESFWKDKTCAACHNWAQSNLCDQAQTYLKESTRALDKQHPYGGAFKKALQTWARGGCK